MKITISDCNDGRTNLHTAPKGWYKYNANTFYYKPYDAEYIEFNLTGGQINHGRCHQRDNFLVTPYRGIITINTDS
jgi:hypothetical protein